MTTKTPSRLLIALATTASITFGGAVNAAAATEDLSSQVSVKATIDRGNGKAVTTKKMPAYTQMSSRIGSSDLQENYNGAPGWAQVILGFAFVSLVSDLFGTLIGPVRYQIFDFIRTHNIPLPVPPRP